MKHWFKKSAAIAMSAVMALSLAACASSKPATPEEVLQAASEKARKSIFKLRELCYTEGHGQDNTNRLL